MNTDRGSSPDAGYHSAGTRAELDARGGVRRVVIEGRRIALFTWNDRVYALVDECPHRGTPLGVRPVDAEGFVHCVQHDWQYRVEDGKGRGGWEGTVGCFDVIERDGEIFVGLAPRPLELRPR